MFGRIFKQVSDLISRCGLLHPRELADYCEVNVLYVPTKRLRGGFIDIPDGAIVVVSPLLPRFKRYGILLHEVAHKILHPGTNRFMDHAYIRYSCGKYELEAHLFALIYAVLWDREGFEECEYDPHRFADKYGLSPQAADVVAREIEVRGPEVLKALGYKVPDPEDWVP
ncbi:MULTISPECIES: ImmA/IrrE family metallo-endopeptidase [Desulfofundulus]|uniref:IrrE N-terminal-like domain-containing protein n=1 Tax=Desulfofundulus thermosubterraneus DSM 16057 TaxID=1121432 RepID=A0A1M6KZL6_9FIRM|nr:MULTISPECIES: ImmA/IrrE family metallo-endopeptidase [Desulfofundulus]NHM28915.1 ImmA/IrrE family metallo-endopeptidase [Desulfofundulus sp. TPOSR]SHJ64294.1 protein of unknown function [Desulfofundulus thermosubterraneus DSM 16057]